MQYNPVFVIAAALSALVLGRILVDPNFRADMNRRNPVFWFLLGFLLYVNFTQPVRIPSADYYSNRYKVPPVQETGWTAD